MPRSGKRAFPAWVVICAAVAVLLAFGFLTLTSRGRERENAAANPRAAVSLGQRRGPDGKPVAARPTPATRDQVPPTRDQAPAPLSEESRRLLAQAPKDQGATTDKECLEDLLKLKEREKRDNALIHYIVGIWSAPEIPHGSSPIATTITQVLKEGWSADAECLRPYLAAWQVGFREIRKGVALDFAQGIGFEKGRETPVPNFLGIHYAVKGLCMEGCLFESEGRYADALDNYLATLTMGRDLTSPGNTMTSDLVGYRCENIALYRIRRLVCGGRLDAASLDHLLARLGEIEKTLGSPIETVTETRREAKRLIQTMETNPEGWWAGSKVSLWDLAVSHDKSTWDAFWNYRTTRYEMTHNLDRAEKDVDDISALQIKFLSTPWWESDPARQSREMEERIEHSHIIVVRMTGANYLNLKVRFLIAQAALRACQVSTAVAAWTAKHGAPPAALRELQMEYFPNGLPVDPFSGKDFVYSVTGGKNYHLSSPGPDKTAGGDAPAYDSTNGTVSRGDIIFAP